MDKLTVFERVTGSHLPTVVDTAGENAFGKTVFELEQERIAKANAPQVPEKGTAERFFRRTGAIAAKTTTQLLDTAGLTDGSQTEYWEQRIKENPHTTAANAADAWDNDEFGTWIIENLGDSLATQAPAVVAAVLTRGALGPMAARASTGLAVAGTPAAAAATAAKLTKVLRAQNALSLTAALAVNANTQGYETAERIRAQGDTPTFGTVVPAAIAKGALDTFALGKMASGLGLGKFVTQSVEGEFTRRGLFTVLKDDGLKAAAALAAKQTGKMAGVEGITEATQEAIDVGVLKFLRNEALWKLHPEEMSQILHAGINGMVLGGVMGGAGSVMSEQQGDIAQQVEATRQNIVANQEARERAINEMEQAITRMREEERQRRQREYDDAHNAFYGVDEDFNYGAIPGFGTVLGGGIEVGNPFAVSTDVLDGYDNTPQGPTAPTTEGDSASPESGFWFDLTGISDIDMTADPTGIAAGSTAIPETGLEGDFFRGLAGHLASRNGTISRGEDGHYTVTGLTGDKNIQMRVQATDSGMNIQIHSQGKDGVGPTTEALTAIVRASQGLPGSTITFAFPKGTARRWAAFAKNIGLPVKGAKLVLQPQTGDLFFGAPVVDPTPVPEPTPPAPVPTQTGVPVFRRDTGIDTPADAAAWGAKIKYPKKLRDRMTGASLDMTINSQELSINSLERAATELWKELRTKDTTFLDKLSEHLNEALRQPAGVTVLNSTTLNQYQQDLQIDAEKYLQTLHKEFLPHETITVMFRNTATVDNSLGWYIPYTNNLRYENHPRRGHVIVIAVPEVYNAGEAAAYRAQLRGTVAHEVGHAIHSSYWHKLPESEQRRIVEMFQLRRAQMLSRPVDAATISATLNQYKGMYPDFTSDENFEVKDKPHEEKHLTYLLHDKEQFAESFAASVLEARIGMEPKYQELVAKWLRTAMQYLRRVRKTGAVTMKREQAFVDFYKWLTDTSVHHRAAAQLATELRDKYGLDESGLMDLAIAGRLGDQAELVYKKVGESNGTITVVPYNEIDLSQKTTIHIHDALGGAATVEVKDLTTGTVTSTAFAVKMLQGKVTTVTATGATTAEAKAELVKQLHSLGFADAKVDAGGRVIPGEATPTPQVQVSGLRTYAATPDSLNNVNLMASRTRDTAAALERIAPLDNTSFFEKVRQAVNAAWWRTFRRPDANYSMNPVTSVTDWNEFTAGTTVGLMDSGFLPTEIQQALTIGEAGVSTVVSHTVAKRGNYAEQITALTGMATRLQQEFLPDSQIVLAFTASGARSAWTSNFQRAGKHLQVISIDLSQETNVSENGSMVANTMGLRFTLAHEIGHGIQARYWEYAPESLKRGVVREMVRYATERSDGNVMQALFGQSPIVAQMSFEANRQNSPLVLTSSQQEVSPYMAYVLEGSEQFANVFADSIMRQSTLLSPDERAYVEEWTREATTYMQQMNFPIGRRKAMNAWMEWLFNERKNEALRAKMRADTGTVVSTANAGARVAHSAAYPLQLTLGQTGPIQPQNVVNANAQAAHINLRGFDFYKRVLSMPHLLDKFNVPQLRQYWNHVQGMVARKQEILVAGDAAGQLFRGLSLDEQTQVSEFLFWLNDTSEKHGVRFTLQDIALMSAGQHPLENYNGKLSDKGVAVAAKMTETFAMVVDKMQWANMTYQLEGYFNDDLRRDEFLTKYITATTQQEVDALFTTFFGGVAKGHADPQIEALAGTLQQIRSSMAAMRNRNYVPKMRHGQHTLRIQATEDMTFEGETFKAGQTVFFYAWDNAAHRDQETINLVKKFAGMKFRFEKEKLPDVLHSVNGLPRAFLDALKNNPQFNFTSQQKAAMEYLSLEYLPSKSFTKHFLNRKNIRGYQTDREAFFRSFSSYMFRAANSISKTEYTRQLRAAINGLREAKDQQMVAGLVDNSPWSRLVDFTEDHFNYVMAPDADWAGLRSFVSSWFLAYMPRSALANLYQVPMATYPYLAAEYGDAATVEAITRAYTRTLKALQTGNYDPEYAAALQKAISVGKIDSSAIVELGASSESNLFDRATGLSTQSLWARYVVDKGFMLFRGAEKLNRRVTFVAAFDLEYQRSKDATRAYEAGIKALDMTQFDMSKEGRAQIFRGGKGVLLQFSQHMFNMTYLATGGFGTSKNALGMAIRTMAVAALVGGAEGLPWAGLGMDLFDLFSSLYRKVTGQEYTHADVRADLRELALAAELEPDLIMHGFSRKYGLGPLSVLSMFGAPNIDLSGSVNLGYPGGWAQMFRTVEAEPEKQWAKIIESFGGPAYGVAHGVYQALTSDDPNVWKASEKGMPAFMRAVSQGTRWMAQGGELQKDLSNIYPVTDDNVIDAVFRLGGFTPTTLAQKYELNGMQMESVAYWQTKKAKLMRDHFFATRMGDEQGLREIRVRIEAYNNAVKEHKFGRQMLLNPRALRQSVRARNRWAEMRESGMSKQKSYQGVYSEVQRRFGSNPYAGDDAERSARWGD